MTDIKEFFIASNTVSNAPDYDSNVLSTLIHTVESFVRVTYQSIGTVLKKCVSPYFSYLCIWKL